MVIVRDFDNLKIDKIPEFLLNYCGRSIHIERVIYIIKRTLACFQMFSYFRHALSSFDIQYQLVTVNAKKIPTVNATVMPS